VGHRAQILASIAHGLSNGLIESVNTKIRLITRMAFGFAHPGPLIALAMLTLGRAPPNPARPSMTHGSVRRATNDDARSRHAPGDSVTDC
jgi:transposase